MVAKHHNETSLYEIDGETFDEKVSLLRCQAYDKKVQWTVFSIPCVGSEGYGKVCLQYSTKKKEFTHELLRPWASQDSTAQPPLIYLRYW